MSLVVFFALAPMVAIGTRDQPIAYTALGALGVAVTSLAVAGAVRWWRRR